MHLPISHALSINTKIDDLGILDDLELL